MIMKTRTLKYMMTAVLLFGTTVAVAGSQPRKVKVKSVVKASSGNGMMQARIMACDYCG